MCARRRSHFHLAPNESNQSKGAPAECVPSLRCGQPVELGYGLHRETHYAPGALRSNRRGESVHEAVALCGATAQPLPCAPRRIQKGRFADAGHRYARPPNRPSAAMAYWYLAVWGLFASPFCMRLGRGVCGVALAPKSASASSTSLPRLFERSALARREFRGTPHKCHDTGCPSQREGSQAAGRPSFGYFSWSPRKVPRPPGEIRPAKPSRAAGTCKSMNMYMNMNMNMNMKSPAPKQRGMRAQYPVS